jgi:hypothetical protein
MTTSSYLMHIGSGRGGGGSCASLCGNCRYLPEEQLKNSSTVIDRVYSTLLAETIQYLSSSSYISFMSYCRTYITLEAICLYFCKFLFLSKGKHTNPSRIIISYSYDLYQSGNFTTCSKHSSMKWIDKGCRGEVSHISPSSVTLIILGGKPPKAM